MASVRVSVPNLIQMAEKGEKIAAITAYDYTSAMLCEQAGVDIVLVGDSLGMVIQGENHTLSVTLDEILYHTKIVSRALTRALLVADLPFMSYQVGLEEALRASGRALKEAGAQAVKLEGGREFAETVRRIVEVGIPVMGHVGLKPQYLHQMGGYKVQGKTRDSADSIIEDALALEQAGAFSLVLEGVPSELGREVTERLSIPTIGIGAGARTSGQILVLHDVLGLRPFAGPPPKFVKTYAELGQEMQTALADYVEEVKSGDFPSSKNIY